MSEKKLNGIAMVNARCSMCNRYKTTSKPEIDDLYRS